MRMSPGLTVLLLAVPLLGLLLLTLPVSHWAILRGRVVDADGPIGGARVRFQSTPTVARTDAYGRFRLPAAVSGRVTAWKEGYFIGGSPSESSSLIHLTRLPSEDNAEYEWVDPAPDPSRDPQLCQLPRRDLPRMVAQRSRAARSTASTSAISMRARIGMASPASVGVFSLSIPMAPASAPPVTRRRPASTICVRSRAWRRAGSTAIIATRLRAWPMEPSAYRMADSTCV